MAMQDVRKQEAEEKADVTERTVSAEEAQRALEEPRTVPELLRELDRLSAWVPGDVARARELAKELGEIAEYLDPAQVRESTAEIVALLTPKDTE